VAFQLDRDAEALEERILNAPVRSWDSEYENRVHRLAAATIRRQANQHGCRESSTQTPCDHPDHRRDRFYAAAMLELLGVPRDLPQPTKEDYAVHLGQEVPAHTTGPMRRRSPPPSRVYDDYDTMGRFN
jgi:hypothetical protein